MKKWLKITLCALLAVIIAGGCVTYAFLPHNFSYDIKSLEKIGSDVEIVSKADDGYTVKKASDGEFKVITFTDTHLDGKNKTSNVTLENIVDNIRREKPDLVIFGGDNVTSGMNRKRSHQFAQMLENLGVYWAAVLGNHEGDNSWSISRPEMISIFSSYEHCLMLEGPDDIWGDGNYYINILNADNTLRHTFVLMDSGRHMDSETKAQYGVPESEDPYDGVKTSQVEWYKGVIAANKEKYGDFKSTVIMHIPLPQMREQAEKIENGEGAFLLGDKREGVCASGFDSGMFAAIKECGSTTKVFFGHDHLNDFALDCDGVYLSYMQPSGYGSYSMASKFDAPEKDWLQGHTVFLISADGDYNPVHYRNCEK